MGSWRLQVKSMGRVNPILLIVLFGLTSGAKCGRHTVSAAPEKATGQEPESVEASASTPSPSEEPVEPVEPVEPREMIDLDGTQYPMEELIA